MCTAATTRYPYSMYTQALSNQKMYEMRAMFGEEAVGLQTGDTSLRPDAHIVIMTTEILRNILYRAAEEDALRTKGSDASDGPAHGQPSGEEPQTQDATQQVVPSGQLASIGLVVLDEVHYLADPNRGSVWEEVIINCPPSMQLLAMSATVRNPADLGGWIGKVPACGGRVGVEYSGMFWGYVCKDVLVVMEPHVYWQVHGACQTVVSKDRPVPLRWHFCHKVRGGTLLLPLYAPNGRRLNQQLLPAESKLMRKGGCAE